MSSDLIPLVIAFALAATVVVVGLRRNLSEATRNGLPRFGGDSEATARLGLYEGAEGRRRPLSRRQGLWLVSIYLLLALSQAASAVLSSDDRLIRGAAAALIVLSVAVLLLRLPDPPGEPAS